MITKRTTVAVVSIFAFALAGARVARAQEGPSTEDRLATALESVMTDEAVDGVAACAAPEFSGWTARSEPGGMYFACVPAPRNKTEPKTFYKAVLYAPAVQKALLSVGLSYYDDYSIFDVATKARVDRTTIDRAAARAVERQKAVRAMRGADALKE